MALTSRTLAMVLCAATVSAPRLAAQDFVTPPPAPGRSWVVGFSHYAKWGMLAAAAGFTALSLESHQNADKYFNGLKQFCQQANQACQIGPDGAYVSPSAEQLWQSTAQADRQARWWLVAGQASLVVSGGMFLIDLVSGNSRPKNIPYTPFQVYTAPRKVGLQLSF